MISAFVKSPDIDVVTQLSLKQAILKILDEHPVRDEVENRVRIFVILHLWNLDTKLSIMFSILESVEI